MAAAVEKDIVASNACGHILNLVHGGILPPIQVLGARGWSSRSQSFSVQDSSFSFGSMLRQQRRRGAVPPARGCPPSPPPVPAGASLRSSARESWSGPCPLSDALGVEHEIHSPHFRALVAIDTQGVCPFVGGFSSPLLTARVRNFTLMSGSLCETHCLQSSLVRALHHF